MATPGNKRDCPEAVVLKDSEEWSIRFDSQNQRRLALSLVTEQDVSMGRGSNGGVKRRECQH